MAAVRFSDSRPVFLYLSAAFYYLSAVEKHLMPISSFHFQDNHIYFHHKR